MSAVPRPVAHPWAAAHRALLVLAALVVAAAVVAVAVVVLATRSEPAGSTGTAPAAPLERTSDTCLATPAGQPC
jgi:hypothetical protein